MLKSLLSLVLRGASQPIETRAKRPRLRAYGTLVRYTDCQKQSHRIDAKGKERGEITRNSSAPWDKRVTGTLPSWWLFKRDSLASSQKYPPSGPPGFSPRRNLEVSS
jgi:hypothetical protein